MRRAILFLVFALFLAMVIQPNLNKQIKEKSKIDVPEQTNSTIITNDTVDNSRCKSKAVICIDASHGGSDAGYTSDGHTSEKDLNLIIAKKIGLFSFNRRSYYFNQLAKGKVFDFYSNEFKFGFSIQRLLHFYAA